MRPIPMPRDRKSLAWLYHFCAGQQGVRPTLDAAGHHTGYTGPKLAVYELLERMRELGPAPALRPQKRQKRQKRR